MEVMVKLEDFNGFKFECEKCGCVVTTSTNRKTMIGSCPDCGNSFYYDDYKDPIGLIGEAVRELEKVKGVKISLICEEDKDA